VNIYHIIAFVFPNSAGFRGVRVLNTLFALELGADPFAVGLLLAMYAVLPLVLAVYVGKVSDRYGVRVPLAGGLLGMALGVVLPFFWPALPALFIAAVVMGAGFIFVQVSTQSLIGSLGAGEQRTRNFNIQSLTMATADLVGPVLAGVLIDTIGHRRTYLYLAALSLASLAVVALMFRRIPVASRRTEGRETERMADLLGNQELRRIFVAAAVVFTGLDLFQLYMPLYGHSIGLSASAIGLLLGAFAAAAFVTRVLLPLLARRFGEQNTLIWALYFAAAAFVLIPFSSSAAVLAGVSFMVGLGLGLGQPLSVILTCNHAPAGRMGEALGLRIAINNVIHVVVPVAFGAVGTLVGFSPVFWASSALLALGGYAARARKPACS
jgi:MFS family permease